MALDGGAYSHIDAVATQVGDAVSEALTGAGVPHKLQTAGSLFSVFFGDGFDAGVTTYEQAGTQDGFRYAAFFHSMLDQGVSLPPSAFEAWFVSLAHDEQAVQRILDALPSAARAAAAAEPA